MTPVTEFRGVGANVAARLEKLGIAHIEDVLFHFPLRYQDRTRVYPIKDLRPGVEAMAVVKVYSARVIFARRRILIVEVGDPTGILQLRFFHFTIKQQKSFVPNKELSIYGECRLTGKKLEMIHPEYRFTGGRPIPTKNYYTPVYPTTDGLNQPSLFRITTQALDWLTRPENQLEELLPSDVDECVGAISLQEAIHLIHRPPIDTDIEALVEGQHPARKRLVFEELFANLLCLKRLRKQDQQRQAFTLKCEGKLFKQLLEQLPFEPTTAQTRVIKEVCSDIQKPHPMMRLVQGDVGCGKTLVAAAAVLQAIECGYQAAIMAPTEILAEQHASNFRTQMEKLDVNTCLISGRQKTKDREALLRYIRQGNTQLIIGTHALFQEMVVFHNLGLIVIDEKHRFGVHQRLLLKEKGQDDGREPHQLVMTATPIPRSLAMMMYADLDYSIIDEMPPGRKPIQTVALPDKRREEVVQRVGDLCKQGTQAYWICTLIEESETLQCRTAEDSFNYLKKALPNLRLGLVHGQMDSIEKEAVMSQFKGGEIDVLVATTVVEVGVDVANASLMVIENAERMGLSQLHQLRGRVGRSKQQSSCVLLYKDPLSEKASRRIEILRKSNDGFEIAKEDMRLRGPGEIMGTRQAGQIYFRVSDLSRDSQLLKRATAVVEEFLHANPQTSDRLIERWLGHLARYGEV